MRVFKQTQNRKLQMIILIIVVSIAVSVSKELAIITASQTVGTIISNSWMQLFIAVAVAIFGYQTIIGIVFFAVNRSKFFLHLYWGRLYLDGYWYYEYVKLTKEGETVAEPKYGVWQIEQDVEGTHISGFGLYDNLNKYRTTVESKTQLIENEHCFEVILSKIEATKPGVKYFAKASITIDNSRKNKQTTLFHSYTYTYGGSQAGEIHIDVYHKVPWAKTEDDVIKFLKDERLKYRGDNREKSNPNVERDEYFSSENKSSEKQSYESESIIKLDNNFDIHIHHNLVKDEVDGRKYYKLYYDEEVESKNT